MDDQGQPITFRQGTADDWPSISPWIGKTWDWGDYITAFVWLDWVSSTKPGHLMVAEVQGQIVGLCRLVQLGEAEWWLEGVRVALERQGQGIGRALLNHMVQRFRRDGTGLLRFFTGSSNEAMITVAESAGFKHLLAYTEYVAEAAPFDYRGFKVLESANLDLAWAYLRASKIYRASHFVEKDWTAYYLTHDRLYEYLASEATQVLGWRNAGKLAGLSIVFTESGSKSGNASLQVGYVDVPEDTTLLAILAALQGVAFQRGYESISWHMPLSLGMERAIAKSAYNSPWDDSLWLFELPVVAGPFHVGAG